MLRLVIADDEKIIRETISTFIDWEKLGIEVVGLCKDGIEAYNTILDEYPDIVLTDIKMPGMTGLDIISRISEMDSNVEFVILSGYGEFNYATEAMRHGVRHYLLKPCNEEDIIKVMEEVVADCYKRRHLAAMKEQQKQMNQRMHNVMIQNVLLEAISSGEDLFSLVQANSQYLDFSNTSYEVCFFYYVPEQSLEICLDHIYNFCRIPNATVPSIHTLHFLYVRNTLVLFFEKINNSLEGFDIFASTLHIQPELHQLEYQRTSQVNLGQTLMMILKKIQRYETIYLINGTNKIAAKNLNYLLAQSSQCIRKLSEDPANASATIQELLEILSGIDDPAYLKTILADLLLNKVPADSASKNPISITEFLLNISELCTCQEIMNAFVPNVMKVFPVTEALPHRPKDFIEKTLHYIDAHLSDSNLSLKWISENYLYMNVDYVSKQFIKQTGVKFSTYLSNLRIERAKKLLLENHSDSIYTVAEEVGFGNNPQYFSQIFKKSTGMTPTAYVKAMRGEN